MSQNPKKGIPPPYYPYNVPRHVQHGMYTCFGCGNVNILDPNIPICLHCRVPSPTRAGTELLIQELNNIPFPGPDEPLETQLADANVRLDIINRFQAVSAIYSPKLNDMRSFVEGIIESIVREDEDN
jgi:hypothetical protein